MATSIFKKTWFRIVAGFVLVLVLVGIFEPEPLTPEQQAAQNAAAEAKQQQLLDSATKITCAALVAALADNEPRALNTYGNKNLIVSGQIDSIDADFMDDPMIILSDGEEFSFSSCTLYPANDAIAMKLNKGQRISMLCDEFSENLGDPVLQNCKLQ